MNEPSNSTNNPPKGWSALVREENGKISLLRVLSLLSFGLAVCTILYAYYLSETIIEYIMNDCYPKSAPLETSTNSPTDTCEKKIGHAVDVLETTTTYFGVILGGGLFSKVVQKFAERMLPRK